MSQLGKHRKITRQRGFTLVEIMVAMALLMVMMSFLFEFILSGQRLWSASEHKLTNYDDGQIVLDVVGEDLRNMVYDWHVGHSYPFFKTKARMDVTVNSANSERVYADVYLFFTQHLSKNDDFKIGIYPICYVWLPYEPSTGSNSDGWAGRLYRVPINADTSVKWINKGESCKWTWDGFNEDFAQVNSTNPSLLPLKDIVENKLKLFLSDEDNVLMWNVSHFALEPRGNDAVFTVDGCLKVDTQRFERPQSVQVELKVVSRNAINEEEWMTAHQLSETELNAEELPTKKKLIERNERSFTKTIRL